MKKLIFLFALLLTQPIYGFYAGLGFSWNTIDEKVFTEISIDPATSGRDRYEAESNRLAPYVTVGHRFCLCDDWILGFSADWKFLNYKTPNVGSSRGQILPNATFSSINIFGPMIERDFTSKTNLYNEFLLLGSVGREVCGGYAYVGAGPVLFNASNSIYNSSVHVNGGSHLISASVTDNKIVWGGAGKAGYQYFFGSDSFLDISYSYLQTGRYNFKNRINAAIYNGSVTPGPTTVFLKREIEFTVQELIISMNLLF